ncbi:MAG: molybdopterin-dependent oxidoreductase [Nitrospirae bacterium]|nr:molybdopterin-dependent oxidoreductase [Nitrospirota bacterium]MBF0534002.1 molybdopterin-dependent oxidoreductase [Nitrospirota bacterium]MBF0616161.1 molybdopterin-dependent oxidoreductase [Nitrospirota bacterium]
MIKLTIDGIEVQTDREITILEAAKQVGIEIPTLCTFKNLSPSGSCRMCLVEIERLSRPQTACTVKITDGMVVRTNSEAIMRARKAVLEFLLINHPLDCPVCDKAGECILQDLSAKYGAAAGRFKEGKRTNPVSFEDPVIVRDMQRCILCTRCVRTCDDLQGAFAISVINRGSHSLIEPFSGGRFDCEYCGNCLSACPVGAITSKLHRHTYRPWYIERQVETICGHCGVGCTLTLQMRENTIIRVIPDFEKGLNSGMLCVMGRFGYDYTEHEERLRSPLIRKDGELVPVSWEEAVEFTAWRLKEIVKKHGGGSVAGIASGRCTNEDNYMLQKLIRYVLGSNNIDSAARLFYRPAVSYLERMFGQGITANLIPGIANSDGVFVAGGDPTTINPVLGIAVRSVWKKGGKVFVLGKSGGLRSNVKHELNHTEGAGALILTWILAKVYEKKNFISENSIIDKKLSALKIPDMDMLVRAGVSPEALQYTADELVRLKNPVVIIGPEMVLYGNGSKNLFLLGALNYVLNGRLFVLMDEPNTQGCLDMGCSPGVLVGGRPVELETFGHKMENTAGMKTPEGTGLNLFEMINGANSGSIKAMFVMGENPVFNIPDKKKVESALQKLEFLAVSDIFLTETASLADVVFPASAWSEKDGTYTNLERRLQRLRKGALSSRGRADWKILADICKALGMKESYTDVKSVWEEISRISSVHAGVRYESLTGRGGIWPYGGEPLRGIEGDFEVEGLEDMPELPGSEQSGRVILKEDKSLIHSSSLSRYSAALMGVASEPLLMINPVTAESLGLSDNERVVITSDKGMAVAVLRADRGMPEGVAALSNTFKDNGFRSIVGYTIDPTLKSLNITDRVVTIERAKEL